MAALPKPKPVITDDAEQLDVDEENILRLEDHDLSKVNDTQRKLAFQADYESLNQKLGDIDDSVLEKQLKIDSVRKTTVTVVEEQEWANVEEIKQDGQYLKSLSVNP